MIWKTLAYCFAGGLVLGCALYVMLSPRKERRRSRVHLPADSPTMKPTHTKKDWRIH